jgi:DNA mismatch repair protein MutS
MNASGKSSLMKAVGIAVILAAIWMFCSSNFYEASPLRILFVTRILNQDDLRAGLSSFAVEMTELRDILKRADPFSLDLGDELCSGTESISATALVASGVQQLLKRGRALFLPHTFMDCWIFQVLSKALTSRFGI